MTRHWNWAAQLVAYIEARERMPFKWGKRKQDCCSFANGAVIAMTGVDAMIAFPDYATAEDADLILVTPLAELVDTIFARCPKGLAQRGDIALAELKGLDTLMVVEGTTLVGPGRRGLVRVPRSEMLIAWTV